MSLRNHPIACGSDVMAIPQGFPLPATVRTHHPLLVSYMTASLGHYAVETGDARAGLTLLRTAAGQLGSEAPDSAGAWMSSLLAVAYAATGDRAGALGRARAMPVTVLWPEGARRP